MDHGNASIAPRVRDDGKCYRDSMASWPSARVNVPVVLFAYNRLDTLKRVMERVEEWNPSTLVLVADGPKARVDDQEKCHRVREYLDRVSTRGNVTRIYSDINMGAGRRIASGLDRVFSTFEEAIVLEDDLLPDATFFPFCEDLLRRYRHTSEIAMISGCNFHGGRAHGPHSYFFSHCVGTWGWATWRRAWVNFDFEITKWPAARDSDLLRRIWPRTEVEAYWRDRLDEVLGGRDDVWDYQWAFCMWSSGALEVYPNENLISHIGCGPDATHLVDRNDPLCNQPTRPIAFPLSHPPRITRDAKVDLVEFHRIFQPLPADVLASIEPKL